MWLGVKEFYAILYCRFKLIPRLYPSWGVVPLGLAGFQAAGLRALLGVVGRCGPLRCKLGRRRGLPGPLSGPGGWYAAGRPASLR